MYRTHCYFFNQGLIGIFQPVGMSGNNSQAEHPTSAASRQTQQLVISTVSSDSQKYLELPYGYPSPTLSGYVRHLDRSCRSCNLHFQMVGVLNLLSTVERRHSICATFKGTKRIFEGYIEITKMNGLDRTLFEGCVTLQYINSIFLI